MQNLQDYTIKSEDRKINVRIVKKEGVGKEYLVNTTDIPPATKALMNDLKERLITETDITASEILDPKTNKNLKLQFRKKANSLLTKILPRIKKETKDIIISRLINEMTGLGDIEFLLNDINLEEIIITSANEPVRVYHKEHGWLRSNIRIPTETQIRNFSNIIARRVGRQITNLNPLLDAHLVTGDRANAVLYPVSTKGNTITIRKFAHDPWTVTDLIANNTCTSEVFALIWLAIQYESSVLISGGTAAGKTTLLNVCMPFMPTNHRIISIEQTRELMLPQFLYWCPLVTRLPNPEGKGEVSMLDLLVNSLRMRPDRVILGEIRRKEEAQVLFEAMHTGHSVYATVHADSLLETVRRLVNPPIEIPENLLEAVNLNVVMFRDRKSGRRRVYQLGEFIGVEDQNEIKINPNLLYRWKPEKDSIIPHNKSLRLFEDLSRHTGLSLREINQDLAIKKKVLDWMVKKKLRNIDQVGSIMNEYYTSQNSLIKKVNRRK